MSSNEEDYKNGRSFQQGPKKRRVQRACEICRLKKIRCDGLQMPGNRCSNCISCNLKCTYVEGPRKRAPRRYREVEGLENRLEKMEKLLHKLCPDKDILDDLDASLDLDTWLPKLLDTERIRLSGTLATQSLDDPRDDDFVRVTLSGELNHTSIPSAQDRFFGKSSSVLLVQQALDLKYKYKEQGEGGTQRTLGRRRPEFWTTRPWEELSNVDETPSYTFPDEDLLYSLVDLYFNQINLFLPLLHRPTFEQSIAAGLHSEDSCFGGVVLLVCALGSRYSEDSRVLLDGLSTYHSAGWKWFDQVQMAKSFLVPPTLCDLQVYCLAVQYLFGCSAAQQSWAMIGIGVRMAQDVGAHRRKCNVDNMTVVDELWKRAFWVLFCLDRVASSSCGHPCAIRDEDFDIDLPVDCDDEYWNHPDPARRFKQPPGKPSSATAFIFYIKVLGILGQSLRTIYSINKSKALFGFGGDQWEERIVAKLDSALNKWVDAIPDQLRWDPNREDEKFFNQAAWLYCTYYYVQIIVHKPFILSTAKSSPLSFPSLAICTNAARSCSHVADIHSRRNRTPSLLQVAVFTSGVVLLLNIWSGKQNGLSVDPVKEMSEVHKCMQILKDCEVRWHPAGRLWDIIYELASVGDLPLPNSTPLYSNKRERDTDSPASTRTSDAIPSSLLSPNTTRSIVGSGRVKENIRQSFLNAEPAEPWGAYSLPVYSEELGRLPVHGEFLPQGQPPLTGSPSYLNHVTQQDVITLDSLFSTDGLMFDPVGSNYDALGTDFLSSSGSSLDTKLSGLHSAEADLHPGEGIPNLANAQPMIDNDAIAMWSNAPSGFELDKWEIYLSNISERLHGERSH